MSWMQNVRDGKLRRAEEPVLSPRYRWLEILLAVGYGWWETAYFGWNLFPSSGAEMACDGIALLLLIVACRPVQQFRELNNG